MPHASSPMISPPDALTVTASGVHAISSSVRRMGVTLPASIRLTTSFRLSRQPGLSHLMTVGRETPRTHGRSSSSNT